MIQFPAIERHAWRIQAEAESLRSAAARCEPGHVRDLLTEIRREADAIEAALPAKFTSRVRFTYAETPSPVEIVADVSETGAVRIRSALWGIHSAAGTIDQWWTGIKTTARRYAGIELGQGHTCNQDIDEQPGCEFCECDHCPACPADCAAEPPGDQHYCDPLTVALQREVRP